MDTMKTWFVEVLIKNVGPKVSAALMSAAIAFLAAHQEIMEKMGITYYPDFAGTWHGTAPSGRLLVVEFDTLQIWGGAALVALVVGAWSLLQHHTVATVTGAPQSGDKREEPEVAIQGGQRAADLKV